MINPLGTTQVALSVFGGLETSLAPTDLPQGLSPGNQNCAFAPGSVFTRPGLVQASAIAGAGQIVYVTSFLNPAGEEIILQFGSNGVIYANGAQIGQVPAGSRFKVSSLFGRAYIAVTDGDHGVDIPLQSDGQYLDRISQDGPGAPPTVANYGLQLSNITSLTRAGNTVTAVTSTPHNLLPGYQFQIQGVTNQAIGGGVSTVVIDNTNLPGLATVTMESAHGLVPGDYVTLTGVQNTAVGGGIASLNTSNGTATLTTQQPHGLQAGAYIYIVNSAGNTGQNVVSNVVNATEFQYAANGTYSQGAGGSVTLIWPDNNSTGSQQYQIQTVPTAESFTIPLDYSNGTFNGGAVTFAWNGTFYVSSVNSINSINYTQVGPNGNASEGTISPQGQISPGPHQCVCIFQTRNGATLAPSPPVTFTAAGGQYLQITNIPIGPPNVIARILAFTGANGARWFYLPVAPQVNGQVVGTATVIPDNSTTSVVLDFGDDSLFAGLAIDIEGNNLFRQQKLGPIGSLFTYKGRLFTWGERNVVQGLVNMGFGGGYVATNPNAPLGWTLNGIGSLTATSDSTYRWTPLGATTLSQPAYQNAYGAPILTGNTLYALYARGNGPITVSITSASVGVIATATVTPSNSFSYANFSAKTPQIIPPDAQITVSGGPIDEIYLVYADNPYLQTARASYIDNLEAFDAETGIIGPANDPHPIRTFFLRRDILQILTDGPNGSLYETQDSASAEPANWFVQMVAAKCGAVSIWGDAQFEDWQIWASDTGLRIFDGGSVEKMSQEVQSWWDSINPASRNQICVANDPYTRRVYVLAPVASSTSPNSCYVLDYRELNTAGALESSTPLKVGFSGRMLTTDLTRKWSPWTVYANYCGLVGSAETAVMTFCGGGVPQLGATYTLLENVVSGVDADYGAFTSSYTTYYFVSADEAQQLKMMPNRKKFLWAALNIAGVGSAVLTPIVDQALNDWPSSRPVPMYSANSFDLQFPLSAQGERVAFQVKAQASPAPVIGPVNIQSGFTLAGMVIAMKDHGMSIVRGSNN